MKSRRLMTVSRTVQLSAANLRLTSTDGIALDHRQNHRSLELLRSAPSSILTWGVCSHRCVFCRVYHGGVVSGSEGASFHRWYLRARGNASWSRPLLATWGSDVSGGTGVVSGFFAGDVRSRRGLDRRGGRGGASVPLDPAMRAVLPLPQAYAQNPSDQALCAPRVEGTVFRYNHGKLFLRRRAGMHKQNVQRANVTSDSCDLVYIRCMHFLKTIEGAQIRGNVHSQHINRDKII